MEKATLVRAAAVLAAMGGGFGINLPRRKYRGDYCITCEKDLPPGRYGRECPKCRGLVPEGEHLNHTEKE